MLTINDEDFVRLYKFIHKEYGIDLSKKKVLIAGRLTNTITELGYHNFKDYVDYILTCNDNESIDTLINKLTTNYTYFMRETAHFDFLKSTILPYLKERGEKKLGIWSAGCSTGQEPYTLAMILTDFFGTNNGWDYKLLASDISKRALSEAVNPIYIEEDLKDLPLEWRKKYFVKNTSNDTYGIAPIIRKNVVFRTFNLMDEIKFKMKFDIIFCRNVMIYFDAATKKGLIHRFYGATNPGGYLCIGHSESLAKLDNPYDYVMPSTFRKKL